MRSSEKRTFIFLAVLVVAVGSASARHLEKRQAETQTETQTQMQEADYFQKFLSKLTNFGDTPVVGGLVKPYVTAARNLLETIESRTDGSLSTAVNSIMPCNFVSNRIQCDGQLDRRSAQTLAKKLIDLVPSAILPTNLASILKVATELI